jgi:hypothetical protein
MSSNLLNDAKLALNRRKLYNWRGFTSDVGLPAARMVLTKLAADSIRKGDNPKLAPIVKDCLLGGVSPVDADVLLRLKVLQG